MGQLEVRQLPWGPGQVDWQERINVDRMRKDRLAKAQKAMKKYGLAVCLLTRPDNMRYATSTRGPGFAPGLRYSLIFAEGTPIVYEHGASMGHNMMHCPWIPEENWRCAISWLSGTPGPEASSEASKTFAKAIVDDLKKKGLAKEKIGVDAVDELGRHALTEAGIKLVPAGAVMLEARRTKTQDEINCHRIAISMVSEAFYHVARIMRPGIREGQLKAEAMNVLLAAGGEPAGALPTMKSGPNAFEDYSGGATDRMLEAGELAYMNICGVIGHMGYLTCYYRDYCVGKKPTAKQKDWHKSVYERIHNVLSEIKPGATTADAAKHMPPASKWGYDSEYRVLTKEIGHGLGLSLYEEPVINRLWSMDHPQVFEEGMVIAVECREGEHFVGGSRLEEMVVVTKTGSELLTLVPANEIIAPGTFG